jgi:hypothetical protein
LKTGWVWELPEEALCAPKGTKKTNFSPPERARERP